MALVQLTWSRTEEFKATLVVDDEFFDGTPEEVQENADALIGNMCQMELSEHFEGCTDLSVQYEEVTEEQAS